MLISAQDRGKSKIIGIRRGLVLFLFFFFLVNFGSGLSIWAGNFLIVAAISSGAMEIQYQEEYIINSRGIQLFTCRWLPLSHPKALVFLCHGYGCECSIFMRESGIRLASAGYGVFGMDYEGHGKSQGKRCYIEKFSNIVSDCHNFFKSVCERDEYRKKARFLYGESMGGAVALRLHRKEPAFWNGAVLVAPMCKISEKLKPHPLMVSILTKLEVLVPMWKIVPTKDLIDSAFKDPLKREQIRRNELIYQERPRLKTALEILRASMDLEDRLHEVTLPFLVLHGEDDRVTDPSVSQSLYATSASVDKTIKLYKGMWHGLTTGEPDHNIQLVFSDIISWLDHRVSDGQLESLNSTGFRSPRSRFPDKSTGKSKSRRRDSGTAAVIDGPKFHHSIDGPKFLHSLM